MGDVSLDVEVFSLLLQCLPWDCKDSLYKVRDTFGVIVFFENHFFSFRGLTSITFKLQATPVHFKTNLI